MIKLLLFTSLFLSVVTSYGQRKKKSTETDSVSYYIALENYDKAIQLLDEKIISNPSSELFLSRGLAKIETNNLDDALLDFNQSLELNPQNDTCYYNIGYIFYLQGNYHQSITYYDSALIYNEQNIS